MPVGRGSCRAGSWQQGRRLGGSLALPRPGAWLSVRKLAGALGLCAWLTLPGALALAGPAVVARGTDVIQAWKPDQRLFVKGNLGVSGAQLASLEQWLETNATNWVVVLLESSEGERYTDAAGETFTGIEAINHALGKGLMNQTAFGQAVDPRTGERNACFFTLFLKDRRFSYYGSEAQDRRGLGEEQWVGGLDAPAIRAMRDGGRIVDAVKDTITNIEGQLTARIAAERQAAERKAAEQALASERAQAKAQADLAAARESVATLTRRTAEFQHQHPEATGDLARPDLPALQAGVALAGRALDSGRFADASTAAADVRRKVEPLLAALDRHGEVSAKFEQLAGRYQLLAQAVHANAAQVSLRQAADQLQSARQEHARGDSSYEGQLAATAAALQAAETTMADAARLAHNRKLLRLFAGSTAACLVLLLGGLLNRRRAKPMREARALYDLWRQGLAEKSRGLFALLDQRANVVGASTLDAEHRYSGTTLDLSRQAIKDVDELFIMSASVDRILGEAKKFLEPASLGGRFGNLFRHRPFDRVLHLLRDEKIRFAPEERVELIVRGPRTERDALLGDRQSYAPFALTFDELIAAFNERAARALNALDQIAADTKGCAQAIQDAQRDRDQAAADVERLREGAAADGWLGLASLNAKLLPKSVEVLAAALQQAATDPVGAMTGPAAEARRLAGDAVALAQAAWRVRQELLPGLAEQHQALGSAGVETGWIDRSIQELSEEADRIGAAAADAPAAERIQAYVSAWNDFAGRVGQAVALFERRRTELEPVLADTRTKVVQARRQVGTTLRLDPAQTLVERDLNPDQRLDKAGEELASAAAALNRGDVAAAQNALEAAAHLAAEANDLVAASLDALARRAQEVTTLGAETARLESLLPDARKVLEGILAGYVPSTWLLGAGDPAHPNANGTIEDNLTEAETSLGSARANLQTAEKIFALARVLEAASFWARAKADHEFAAARLQEIQEKQERLRRTEAANAAALVELEHRAASARPSATAVAARPPTLELFGEIQAALAQARSRKGAQPADPFAMAAALESVRDRLARVEEQARSDQALFDEAGRSVQAAQAQLALARTRLTQVQNSGLPPSPATRDALGELQPIPNALQRLQAVLQQPHQDWAAVDAEADQLTARAAALAATLAGEHERGQQAVAALTTAATAVRSANAWAGGFGVLILGSPGTQALAEARQALDRGAYDEARARAETARRLAAAAVAQAQAEVMRRRAAEEAAREQERARRRAEEAARQARRAAGSGFGGGSSWGGSGSGFRGSGFGSGSGARTSGW